MSTLVTAAKAIPTIWAQLRKYTSDAKLEAAVGEMTTELAVTNEADIQIWSKRHEQLDRTVTALSNDINDLYHVFLDLVDYLEKTIPPLYEHQPQSAPPIEDRENAARAMLKMWFFAGSKDKRKVLWAAFSRQFRPSFYREGLQKILWELVEALEYNHCKVLDQICRGNFYPNSVIRLNSPDYFYARKLIDLGLVIEIDRSVGQSHVVASIFADTLRDFISPALLPT